MSKEGKKANGGQREEGCWGCVGERRAVMEESMEGESLGCSGTSRTKTQVQQSGGVGWGKSRWDESRSWCNGSFLLQRSDGQSSGGRFPCACCSTARCLCCSESMIARQEGGMGREEEEEQGTRMVIKKKKKKHPSTVFQLDWTNGENGQPIAVLTAFNAFSSWIIEDAPKENGRQAGRHLLSMFRRSHQYPVITSRDFNAVALKYP